MSSPLVSGSLPKPFKTSDPGPEIEFIIDELPRSPVRTIRRCSRTRFPDEVSFDVLPRLGTVGGPEAWRIRKAPTRTGPSAGLL